MLNNFTCRSINKKPSNVLKTDLSFRNPPQLTPTITCSFSIALGLANYEWSRRDTRASAPFPPSSASSELMLGEGLVVIAKPIGLGDGRLFM